MEIPLPTTEKWLRDVGMRGLERAHEKRRWIRQLARLTREISLYPNSQVPPDHWPHVALFWIRLYGVVEELPKVDRSGYELWKSDQSKLRAEQALLTRVFELNEQEHVLACAIRD